MNLTVITGDIKGAKDQWVKVMRFESASSGSSMIDSFHLNDGLFMFKMDVDVCNELYFLMDGKYTMTQSVPFYADAGSIIHVSGNINGLEDNGFISLDVKGSKIHDEAKEAIERNDNKYFNLREIEHYIAENPNSQFSGSLLQKYVGLEKMYSKEENPASTRLFEILSDDVKNSFYGKRIPEELLKSAYWFPNGSAFDFTIQDVNDDKLSLRKLKDKYLLIHFWNPLSANDQDLSELKDVYNKYHDLGLEIVSIAIDGNDEASWKRVIDEEGIEAWRHILYDSEKVRIKDAFDFVHSKTTFLLDDNKKIVKRVTQDNLQELKIFMDNLFKDA